MNIDLDMNGFDIINVGSIVIDGDIIEADTVTGSVDFQEVTPPASPSADTARLYAYDSSSTTRMAYKDSAGNVRTLASTSAATTDNAIARYDGTAGLLQNSSGVTISDANTVSISPTAASINRGISISQTGPTSGEEASAPVYFNRIDIDAAGTHALDEGDIIGLGVSMGLGGSNAAGQHIALFGQTVVNSATSNTPQPFLKVYAGVTGIAQGSVNDGGTSTSNSTDAKGYLLGMNSFAILAAGATNYLHCTAHEMLTTVRTGASVRTHVGMRIVQYFDHAVSGANLDAGLQFINQTGAVGWAHYGIIFDGTSDDAGTMFKSTATVLGVTGTPTVTHGIDFQTVSFTGAAFRSNGFFVNGSGDVNSPSLTGGLSASSNLVIKSTGGVGTTDYIAFRVGNNGATEVARMLNGGQSIFGHTAAIDVQSETGAAFTPHVQIQAAGATATASITRWSANANQGRFVLAKSRGASIGTRGAVADGDALGTIVFNGDDGTNFLPGAAITATVFGTPGTNDLPTTLDFFTTADGAATSTRQLRIQPTGRVLAINPTGGIGYGAGAGGTVTQATSKSTGVTLNTACGQITMNNASLAATTNVSFTFTNSAIQAGDQLVFNHSATGTLGAYNITSVCSAGSAAVTVRNLTAGALGEAIVLQYVLIKSVTA